MAENNPAMPEISGQAVYEVSVIGSLFGQRTINVFYYIGVTPGPEPVSQTGLANAFWDAVGTEWCDAVSDDWFLTAVAVKRVDVYGFLGTVVLAGDLANPNIQGTRGDSCAPQVAVVHKRNTLIVGKRGRGRVYIAGIPEADMAGGIISGALSTLHSDLDAKLGLGLVVGGETLGASQVFWQHTPPSFVTLRGLFVAQWSHDLISRSQRRRQIGRGQ